MTECTWTRGVLVAFIAHDKPDLPDEAALHLDACADCRAHFDALLAPPVLAIPAAPAALRAGMGRVRTTAVASVALAAAALLAVVGGAAAALPGSDADAPDLGISIVEAYDIDEVCLLDEGYRDAPETCPVDLT